MPEAVTAPAAAPAPSNGASAKPSGNVVKPNPVSAPPNMSGGKQAAAAPVPQTTTPPEPARHKWTDKIDGKDVEFDASDDDLRAAYRLRSASDRRFNESAAMRKEAAAEAQRAEQTLAKIRDRKQVLKEFKEANPDVDMTAYLADELQQLLDEEEKLQDPNIRERRKMQSELDGYKTREEQAKHEAEFKAQETEVNQHRERWAGLFKEAIGLTKMPVNDLTMKMMADAQYTARQKGWDLTPPQLAQALEKGVGKLVEAILSNEGTTDDQLLDAHPALVQRIHKALVARSKARKAGNGQPSAVAPQQRRLSTEANAEQNKLKVLNSKDEAAAYGTKGLRTI